MMALPAALTPLLGGDPDQPACYLLQLGGATILLDCGWNSSFDVALLEPVVSRLDQVDAVLLSHPDLAHLGALPYLRGRAGLAAPVFATRPVVKMGTMALFDALTARQGAGDFDAFSMDHIEAALDEVRQLKFQQTWQLTGRCAGISITAHPAGHLVGGTAWSVRVGAEEVVYAMSINHQAERHLNAPQLGLAFSRPALVISDAAASQQVPSERRRRREEGLCEALLAVLRSGGSCLLPVDAAGRVLELLLVLDAYWGEHKLAYPLVFMSSVVESTLKFARTQLEYMSDSVNNAFMTRRDNAFACKHVLRATAPEQLASLPQGPKVVLASGPDLEPGLARQLLLQWAPDPRNAIVLTQRPARGSLADRLAALMQQPLPPGAPRMMQVESFARVPLEGEELEEHLRRQAEEAAAAEAAEAAAAEGADQATLRASSGAISKLVVGEAGGLVQVLSNPFGAEGVATLATNDAGVLIDGFTIPAGACHAMFPDGDAALTAPWDEYGAAIPDAGRFEGLGEGEGGGGGGAGGRGGSGLAGQPGGGEGGEEEDAAMEEAGEEGPTKVVAQWVALPVAARVLRLAFDGLADFASAATILSRIAPRHLMLVGAGEAAGGAAAAKLAAPGALGKFGTAVAVAAQPGAAAEVALSASWPLVLAPALLRRMQLRSVAAADDERYQVAWVDAMLEPWDEEDGGDGAAAQAAAALEAAEQGQGASAPAAGDGQAADAAAGAGGEGSVGGEPRAAGAGGGPRQPDLQLVLADQQEGGGGKAAAAAGEGGDQAEGGDGSGGDGGSRHGGIFIGTVQLSNLKQALALAGLASEFRVVGGERCLVVGPSGVLVRRAPGGCEGALQLEGPLSDEYWRIRDVVYGQFSIA